MNVNMYSNSIVRENISILIKHGFNIIEPEEGDLACGWEGKGRLPEINNLLLQVEKVLTVQDFKQDNILITAGATREHIDPVRFISNPSTGKMGYAMAEASWLRGASATLISGHSELSEPYGVKTIKVENAYDMYMEAHNNFNENNIIIKCAAVSDFTPKTNSNNKIKRNGTGMNLKLEKTDDILQSLGNIKTNEILVGFAAETDNLIQNSIKKLKNKNLDLIVSNDINKEGAGFGTDTNIAYLIDKNENVEELPIMSKKELAHKILDKINELRS